MGEMKGTHWQELLGLLKVSGKIRASHERELNTNEKAQGYHLPASYRSYCLVFGPGILADWYTIAVPGYDGRYKTEFDLTAKTDMYRKFVETNQYSPDPDQFSRAMVFGNDSAGALYYWDPLEITDPSMKECAVYALFRDFTLERLSDTFSGFLDICLHRDTRTIYDDPPKMEFRAATGWKRQGKKK